MTTYSWDSLTHTIWMHKSEIKILISVGVLIIVYRFIFFSLQPFRVVYDDPTTYIANLAKEEIAFQEAVIKEIENLDPKETLILKVNKKPNSTETLIPSPTKNTSNENPNFESGETLTETLLDNKDKKMDVPKRECDIYKGKWVYDKRGPLYTNNSCPIITQMQNCQGNGRSDKGYENWRWKPNDGCDFPRFQPKKFLELMRGKTLAFVGDSLARNQYESLLCILWQVEAPENKGNKKMHRWYFPSTSTLVIRIWSSFLVYNNKDPIGTAKKIHKVFLDVPDETFMNFVSGFDVLVLSSGHWYSNMNAYVLNSTDVGPQFGWPQHASTTKFNNSDAFGISTETALTALSQNSNFTGLAIVRSYSPSHYEHGAWNRGGSCMGKTEPVKELVKNTFIDTMYSKQIQGFQKAMEKAGKSSKMELMDVTGIFELRPDGHPGPYRKPDPNKKTKRGPNGEPPPQDCLHWCMPGPVDTWNEMLLEIVKRHFQG